jgi:small GTP-binding protein
METPPPQEPLRMKIVVIGSQSVGKTSIINAYVYKGKEMITKPTINLAFSKKDVEIGDRLIHLQICDTAGQEQFQSVCPNFYRDAQGALVVFDVTSLQSFQRIRYWIDELSATMRDPFIFCIVGNKTDKSDKRIIKVEDGLKLASENDALYQETSALTGRGIALAFGKLCEKFVKISNGREATHIPNETAKLDQPVKRDEQEKCC